MKLLLDTHALLWWWQDHPQLSGQARAAIAAPGNTVLVSVASVWEMAIKQHQGKLDGLPVGAAAMEAQLRRDGFDVLPILVAHALRAASHPAEHRDPFDRMLAAQAELEEALLVTRDPALAGFSCQILW